MTQTAIETRGARRTCGTYEAVRGVDLTIDHGELFALLGTNGAGKTSTVELIETPTLQDTLRAVLDWAGPTPLPNLDARSASLEQVFLSIADTHQEL